MSVVPSIATLTLSVTPVSPHVSVEEVGEYFLSEECEPLLSIPIVDDGEPVGVISRYQMMNIFLKRYGRELHGRKPISTLMNAQPLVVSESQSMEDASRYITSNIRFPITEDFIIVRDGVYAGVGVVLDLLKAMESQLVRRSEQLSTAYRELKSSQAQLIQSEKMASLGQMVAGVAHEINTPLGYVRNNVELFLERQRQHGGLLVTYRQLFDAVGNGDADDEQIYEQLAQTRELHEAIGEDAPEEMEALFNDTFYGIDQISELVASLKNFSRVDQAMSDNVNINDCLETTLKIAHNALKHKVTVIRHFGDIPAIRCMPSKLNQVFLNLVTNAAQAIEGEGKILLKTKADGESVTITIEDNGKGIPDDVLPRIFDPFFTTKPVGHGTGLGLAISYQIIKEHGGTIRVASKVGVGTRFVIRLPQQAAATQRLAANG